MSCERVRWIEGSATATKVRPPSPRTGAASRNRRKSCGCAPYAILCGYALALSDSSRSNPIKPNQSCGALDESEGSLVIPAPSPPQTFGEEGEAARHFTSCASRAVKPDQTGSNLIKGNQTETNLLGGWSVLNA
jgi:hypothetical protein